MINNYESDYAVVCVNSFAKRKGLNYKEAYLYLYNHKGLDFLKEFYDIEHTLSIDDAIHDLTAICRNNGGEIT
ncbi:MAG: DUF3791 domain-containing protein [Clostridia bacterium]|nr:DUF3791 domain-containing protein [Clostridia bacterium]